MKRKYTRTIFRAEYAEETGVFVEYIYNKAEGCLEDVIQVVMVSASGNVIFRCRLDEAIILAAGLNKVAGQMLVGQLPIPKGCMKYMEEVNP